MNVPKKNLFLKQQREVLEALNEIASTNTSITKPTSSSAKDREKSPYFSMIGNNKIEVVIR
jgi:hypothetical protein